jgi:hypothetical protein
MIEDGFAWIGHDSLDFLEKKIPTTNEHKWTRIQKRWIAARKHWGRNKDAFPGTPWMARTARRENFNGI